MGVWFAAKINFGFDYLKEDFKGLKADVQILKLDMRDMSERVNKIERRTRNAQENRNN